MKRREDEKRREDFHVAQRLIVVDVHVFYKNNTLESAESVSLFFSEISIHHTIYSSFIFSCYAFLSFFSFEIQTTVAILSSRHEHFTLKG